MCHLLHKTVPEFGSGEAYQALTDYAVSRDPQLRDRLVMMHMNLVRGIASRFADRGEPLEDLIQVGTIGLIHALDRYDPSYGTRFSTYATHTILGEIKRHFRDRGWGVKVPRRLQELRADAIRAAEALRQKTGYAPTIAEIAEIIGSSEEETLEAMELAHICETFSLNEVFATENEEALDKLLNVSHVDNRFSYWEMCRDLNRAIDHLDFREKQIIYLRFFAEMSQAQIAERLHISQAHVSRLQQRALTRLKQLLSDG